MTYSGSNKRILASLGYYDYQQGIIYRHLHQGDGWNRHLEKCRNYILKAYNYYKPSKVTIFGSGWLLDIPLAELVERKCTVILIDIIHPPEVRSQTAGLKNVYLVEDDVTGGLLTEIWEKAGRRFFLNRLGSLSGIKVPDYSCDKDPGMVVSLNILTQLEILPMRFLRKKAKVNESEFLQFRKIIQEKHLDFLLKYRSVLITDTIEKFTYRDGTTTESQSVIIDFPEGKNKEEWVWDFDLKGSDFNEKRSVMKVTAMIL